MQIDYLFEIVDTTSQKSEQISNNLQLIDEMNEFESCCY
jgi:hypothetical protein